MDIAQQLAAALLSDKPHTLRMYKGRASDDDIKDVINALDELFVQAGKTIKIEVEVKPMIDTPAEKDQLIAEYQSMIDDYHRLTKEAHSQAFHWMKLYHKEKGHGVTLSGAIWSITLLLASFVAGAWFAASYLN